jgi:CHASE2 domain-containing sensor protein
LWSRSYPLLHKGGKKGFPPRGDFVEEILKAKLGRRSRPDWRGWITLVWVIVWGWAYGTMAFHARAPQVLAWLRSWTAGH